MKIYVVLLIKKNIEKYLFLNYILLWYLKLRYIEFFRFGEMRWF
jgi:hypothetical protein